MALNNSETGGWNDSADENGCGSMRDYLAGIIGSGGLNPEIQEIIENLD